MPVLSAHKSDIGRKKNRNEDYLWVEEQAGLYILADGMGGQEAGEIASQLATDTLRKLIGDELKRQPQGLSTEAIKALLLEALERSNTTVFNAAQAAGHRRQMGTTVLVALIQASTVYISHAGDSRAYLIKGSVMKQLTEDDSYGAFSAPALKSAKGKRSALDHFLTKYVGQENALEPSFVEVEVAPGDWLLLCSDGLWSMVDEEQILAELQKAGDPDRLVDTLVSAANEAGGEDNISVVAIKILAS
jgi:protein phosphatase